LSHRSDSFGPEQWDYSPECRYGARHELCACTSFEERMSAYPSEVFAASRTVFAFRIQPSFHGMLGVCQPQRSSGGSACSFEVSRRSEWLCMGSILPLAYWDLMIIPNAVFSSDVPAHNPASSFHVSVGNIIEMTSMTAKIVVLGAPRSTRSPGHH
jgi:hypothetical protein